MAIAATLDELRVPIDSVRAYGRNPRRGDLPAIKRSLEVNGQYRPIVVNRRSGEVLAGNHTWLAARELEWPEIAVTFVDVDEQEAARIVLADNRTAELGGYDDTELAALLASLPGLEGTAWQDRELERLLARIEKEGVDAGRDTEPGPRPARARDRARPRLLRRDRRPVAAAHRRGGDPAMRCTATTRQGNPCRNHATRGADRCSSHRRPAPDAATVEQLLSMLRAGNYLEVAARATGIRLDELPADLRDELETARAEGELRAVTRIAAAATESWQAAAFLLERQYPDRWGRPAVRQEGEKTPAVVVGVDSLDELAGKRDARRASRR